MEKSGRAWQWYGYAVCLTAVITGLANVAGLIDHAFDLANPLASQRADGSLTSFEAYKATRERPAAPDERPAAADTVSDATLRTRYEALRADRLAQSRFHASKRSVINVVMLLIAVVLFVTHWRWLRRAAAADSA